MDVLVLNGSPRMEASKSFKLTKAFLAGLAAERHCSIQVKHIYALDIKPCRGCFSCFAATPGQCVITDGHLECFDLYLKADVIIWSFPVYVLGMPSQLKAFCDRCLPRITPAIIKDKNNRLKHPARFPAKVQRHVLISTCGLPTRENNYELLLKHFELMGLDPLETILCPQGEMLSFPKLAERVDRYLGLIQTAGRQYAVSGCFSAEVKTGLEETLMPVEEFVAMVNRKWAD